MSQHRGKDARALDDEGPGVPQLLNDLRKSLDRLHGAVDLLSSIADGHFQTIPARDATGYRFLIDVIQEEALASRGLQTQLAHAWAG